MQTDSSAQEFKVQSFKAVASGAVDATYDSTTGLLEIPYLVWYGLSGTPEYVSVEMKYIAGSDPMQFQITSVIGLNLGDGPIGPTGPQGPQGAIGLRA